MRASERAGHLVTLVRDCVDTLTLAMLATGACTTSSSTTSSATVGPEGGSVRLSDAVEVDLPPNAVPAATVLTAGPTDPAAQLPLSAPVTIPGGRTVPSPWAVVGSPVHIASSAPLTGTATLNLHLPTGTAEPVVLLTREDGSAAWHPVDASYDAAGARLIARTTHFSDWLIVTLAKDRHRPSPRGSGTPSSATSPSPSIRRTAPARRRRSSRPRSAAVTRWAGASPGTTATASRSA